MQSGRPAASGGFVKLLMEVEPVAIELALLPLIVLLPLLVPGVSVRTCLVTASQDFPALVLVVVELGEVVVVVGVWAIAIPMPPASIAAASPIPIIRIRRIPSCADDLRQYRRDGVKQSPTITVPVLYS